MQESVVPIRARKTVSGLDQHEPPRGVITAEEPRAGDHHHVADRGAGAGRVGQLVAGVEEVVGGEVLEQVADHALDEQREEHRPGNVPLGVLRFLAHRGHRLETDQDQDRDTGLDEGKFQLCGFTTEAAEVW